jgi:hypothetical protein
MPSSEDIRRFAKLKEKLLSKARILKHQTDESLVLAIDRSTESQVDLYHRLEEHLARIRQLTEKIVTEIEGIAVMHELRTAENRLNFLEDRFDEMDSQLRNRPRRRRNRINLSDFFRTSQGGFKTHPTPDDVQNANEAFSILGLDRGSPLHEVTRAFRRKVKDLHPDSRNGDRSAEPELRRLLAAYEFLKSYGG